MALLTPAEIAALRIERIVLHEVGPGPNDFKLFDGDPDFGELVTFFVERLIVANKGSAYEFEVGSDVLAALRVVDADATSLEAHGRALATRFNEQHRGNTNAGTFVVFVLAAEARRFYAVVKFDHRPSIDIDDTMDRAQLRLLTKTIVESPDAMQKSAIILLTEGGGDLAVRDRKGPGSIPAYFLRFLGVKRRFSETELTTKLADVIKEVAAENEATLPAAFLYNLPTRIFQTVQNLERFDAASQDIVTAFFGQEPAESPVRTSFAAKLREAGLEDEEFAIDRAAVPRPTRERLVTNEGIEVNYSEAVRARITEIPLPGGEVQIQITTSGILRRVQLT